MPRRIFECDPTKLYHVTNRSINKDWFSMPLEEVWNIFESEMYFLKHGFNLQIFALVLMSNHYHLLIKAPDKNLSEALSFFQSMTARRIVKAQGRINHLWAHRFKRSQISTNTHMFHAYRYIYQNPLRAGIVERVEEYPYSTLSGLLGLSKIGIPVEYDSILFSQDLKDYLSWINQPYSDQDVESIGLALRRSVFKLPRIKNKKNPLEYRVF